MHPRGADSHLVSRARAHPRPPTLPSPPPPSLHPTDPEGDPSALAPKMPFQLAESIQCSLGCSATMFAPFSFHCIPPRALSLFAAQLGRAGERDWPVTFNEVAGEQTTPSGAELPSLGGRGPWHLNHIYPPCFMLSVYSFIHVLPHEEWMEKARGMVCSHGHDSGTD